MVDGLRSSQAIGKTLTLVERSLARFREAIPIRGTNDLDAEAEWRADELIREVVGKLIPLATVKEKSLGMASYSWCPQGLDDESAIMLETAQRVGRFLEALDDLGTTIVDFTPGAQGAWKAFEREVNLSAIQAARCTRGIEMPDFFTLFKPGHPCKVPDGQGKEVDINEKGKLVAGRRQHKFITLGKARQVIRTLLDEPESRLTSFFEENPDDLLLGASQLEAWERLAKIRNDGSHVEALDRARYLEVLQILEHSAVLLPLLTIKSRILQHKFATAIGITST